MAKSAAQRLLEGFTGGGGGGADFYKLTDGKQNPVRLYRFDAIDLETRQVNKELCAIRVQHWKDKKSAPCDGAGCKRCSEAAMQLASALSDDDKKKAQELTAKESASFAVIDIADPTKFKIMEGGWGLIRKINLEIAAAGGWVGPYPDKKQMFEGGDPAKGLSADGQAYLAAFDLGISKVCGPNGRDIVITYKKNQGMNTHHVVIRQDGNKVLPFLEDANVPNPADVFARISAAGAEGGD